jgi:hypothetical protein
VAGFLNYSIKKYMKTKILTLVFVAITSSAFSQNDMNPPRRVRESFQKEYPQSQPSHWRFTAGNWNVVFEDRDNDNGQVTAHFDSRGRHVDSHIRYDENDVPAPVKDNLRQKYDGSDNYEYTRIDRPGREDIYQARFRHHKKYRTVYLDETGREKEYHYTH